MVKKSKNKKQKGGRADILDYKLGGPNLGELDGFINFGLNIAGGIIWSINSVIASANTIEDIMHLNSDLGTAWGPNVPQSFK